MANLLNISKSPLTCHAFNANCSMLAVSAHSHEILIFSFHQEENNGEKLKIVAVLSEHNGLVTSIDWAPKSNQIVSTSEDHSAFVWVQHSDGQWKPTFVGLLINRAFLDVRWSPLENKFAIGTGAANVAVCTFDAQHNWWSSKVLKKGISSSVSSIDWHPNNNLLACAGTDFVIRIFSAAIKDAGDQKPRDSTWGPKAKFGDAIFIHKLTGGGWVHCLRFSSDGRSLAWVSHDSSIGVAESSGIGVDVILRILHHTYLPFLSLTWITSNHLVCAGHDCLPLIFQVTNSDVEFYVSLDQQQSAAAAGQSSQALENGNENSELDDSPESSMSLTLDSFSKFRLVDRMRSTCDMERKLDSLHQNSINEVRVALKNDNGKVLQLSTIGRDGALILWNVPDFTH